MGLPQNAMTSLMKRFRKSRPVSPRTSPSDNDPMYCVCRLPGKGLGVVATRTISAGEVIFREAPFLRVELDQSGDLRGRLDPETGEFRSADLDRALAAKSDEDLYAFYSLEDAFRLKHSKRKSNFGIVKTNSFSVSSVVNTGEGKNSCHASLVLFPNIARLNHSCAPNCHHYWSNKHGCFMVRAARVISKGEEVCISYMSPLQRADFHRRDSRRQILQAEFGFFCLCELCSRTEDHTEDDGMRERVLQIEEEWSELGSNPSRALTLGEEQMSLCLRLRFQAGLLSYVALHCVEAVALLLAVRQKSSASSPLKSMEVYRTLGVKHAREAHKHALAAYGEGSEELEVFALVEKVMETASDEQMLGEVQAAIVALRDIDS